MGSEKYATVKYVLVVIISVFVQVVSASGFGGYAGSILLLNGLHTTQEEEYEP